jgi:sugar phosphate isomerase/epimerase
MPYHRSISTLGCPELSLEQTLQLARRHQLDAVELRALKSSIDLPAVFNAAYGSPAALAERMSGSDVRIVALDTSLRLAANTSADRDDFLRFVPWAEALGVPWLRVFDGGHAANAETLQAMAETVSWWRTLKQEQGWRSDIMVETHDALFTTAAIQQFIIHSPGTAILWDSQHTWRNGKEDPVDTWRAIARHVGHVHVKDSVSQPRNNHPFTYVLPGEGEFPMASLRAILQAEFYGTVSLEWEKLWHPYLSPIENALTAASERRWW